MWIARNVIPTDSSRARPLHVPPAMPTQPFMPAHSARIALHATIHPTGIRQNLVYHTQNLQTVVKAEVVSITAELPAANATRLQCAKLPVLPAMTAIILTVAVRVMVCIRVLVTSCSPIFSQNVPQFIVWQCMYTQLFMPGHCLCRDHGIDNRFFCGVYRCEQ